MMKSLRYLLHLGIVFTFVIQLFAQVTTYHGNLLKVDMNSDELNLNNTEGSWTKWRYSKGTVNESYLTIFSSGQETYYLLSSSSSGYDYDINNGTSYYLNKSGTADENSILSYYGWYDVPDPYLFFDPYIRRVENGTWILFGTLGNTFVRDDDSLFISPNYSDTDLIHIAGKINEEYLIAYKIKQGNYYEIKYFLADLSSSPQIKNMRQLEIDPAQDDNYRFSITKLSRLEENLYAFLSGEGKLWIAEYKDDSTKATFNLIKSHEWFFPDITQLIGSTIFIPDGEKILTQQIDLYDYSLSEEEILIDDVNYAKDNGFNSNFFSFIRNDLLLIYSLKEKGFVNAFDLMGIDYRGKTIVDSPFVYIQQILSVTDTESDKLINEFTLEQNYPNPFNPTTKISFTIPNKTNRKNNLTHTKLVVYDALGQVVETLVDEFKIPGTYKINFNASGLSSGIYFYKLRSGNFTDVKKMVFIR